MSKIIPFLLTIFLTFAVFLANSNGNVSLFLRSPKQIEAGQEFTVYITVNKLGINGFSKFEVVFPKGFYIEPIEKSGSTFIMKENKAKFIWLNLPESESFNISYKVVVPEYFKGIENFKGAFYYIEGNEKMIQQFSSRMQIINNNITASLTVPRSINKNYDNILSKFRYKQIQIVFNVQVGAFKTPVTNELKADLFPDQYRLKVKLEDGLYKYYIGSFYSLNAATLFVKYNNLQHAFIIPYYKGKRISLSEAKEILLLSGED